MFVFLDTETTGTGPEDRLCQIAFKPEGGPAVCKLFNPGMPISVDAMAIHHITNKMVQGKPFFRGSETHTQLRKLTGNERTVIVAHNALGDILVLEGVFNRMNTKFRENDKLEDPVQEMIRISSNPVLIPRMPFGKHKGALFSELPRDYLEWLLTTGLDEDMAYTVKRHLGSLSGE